MTKKNMISLRMDDRLLSKAVTMASLYSDGDLSRWIRHCVENYQPKVIKKKKRASRRTPANNN